MNRLVAAALVLWFSASFGAVLWVPVRVRWTFTERPGTSIDFLVDGWAWSWQARSFDANADVGGPVIGRALPSHTLTPASGAFGMAATVPHPGRIGACESIGSQRCSLGADSRPDARLPAAATS